MHIDHRMQTECDPPGNITITVTEVEADSSYLRLSLLSVRTVHCMLQSVFRARPCVSTCVPLAANARHAAS